MQRLQQLDREKTQVPTSKDAYRPLRLGVAIFLGVIGGGCLLEYFTYPASDVAMLILSIFFLGCAYFVWAK
jgi:hypothetical protein